MIGHVARTADGGSGDNDDATTTMTTVNTGDDDHDGDGRRDQIRGNLTRLSSSAQQSKASPCEALIECLQIT